MDEVQKPSLFKRVGRWVSTHQTRSIIGVGVVLIAAASITAWIIMSQPRPPVGNTFIAVKPKPVPIIYYSPLTGVAVANQAATEQAVTAIMIENSPDARPQSGLKSAGIVYEAIAEGGITRFLTLFQEDKPQLIGPVRSVRPYFVDWLAPYQASVAHVGGSYTALQTVRNGKFRDIDQFFNGAYYWRSTDRYAPHNVYTSFAKLDALNKSKGYTTSTFTGFVRADGKPATKPAATSVDINFSGPLYNTHYAYDTTSNTYERFYQGGVPHMDREKGQIAPTVVIAMHVQESTVFEDGYRQEIVTTGSGNATVFQNGTATNVTWKKAAQFQPLQLLDASGKPFALGRGQTWIAAVPAEGSVSWK